MPSALKTTGPITRPKSSVMRGADDAWSGIDDIDRHGGGVALGLAVGGAVRELVCAGEDGGGCVGDRAVGVDRDGSVGGVCRDDRRQGGWSVGVGVVGTTLMLTGLPAVVVALSGLATGASLMGLMVMLAVAVVLVGAVRCFVGEGIWAVVVGGGGVGE